MPAAGVLRVVLEGHSAAHESRGRRIIGGLHVDFLPLNDYYDPPGRQEETPRVSMHEYYRQGRRAAFWGLVVALSLGVVQFLGCWFGGSVALVSDAFHSLGDAMTSFAVFGALLWAQQPADAEHPYGHTRAEAVAGSNVALEWYTLVIAAAGIALKEGLYRYEIRIARSTGSGAVRASAWDHRLDAFGSLAVLAGLALARWGGPDWHAADHVAAIIVG